ncbi:MAG: PxxKW family cysteine-rich protein [Desulfobacterales bacterium]|nr:PxxKW family cysteine-rich protein [Desulfobacterales bacterium]
MICTTIRKNTECTFMSSHGCNYVDGFCHPIQEKCDGCRRVLEYETGRYCQTCPDPKMKWTSGHCNLATHVSNVQAEVKQKVNPLKQSKRMKKK